ncbi:hypothetical protein IAR55_002433 [Kwoniella newhampshirensis]|uniref:Rho-GAP domain-containing protein n=1 Tax=Kwoniella newhampshirensis TaxID=1651941 RepID=A0AAW0Z0P7_9TREE
MASNPIELSSDSSSSVNQLTSARDRERERPTLSRPLSEISENESHRRSSARSSVHSSSTRKDKGVGAGTSSRPVSEAKDKEDHTSTSTTATKRLSSSAGMPPIQSITVNLVDYAKSQSSSSSSSQIPRTQPPTSTMTAPQGTAPTLTSSVVAGDGHEGQGPPPPSPSTKPPPELPKRPEKGETDGTESNGLIDRGGDIAEQGDQVRESRTTGDKGSKQVEENTGGSGSESSRGGISSYLLAKRASLRPSPLGISYADVAKPVSSSPASLTSDSQTSLADAPRSSTDGGKPPTKSKPSWLRRASGTAAMRTKSKSPVHADGSQITASASLPPVLPPRKGLVSTGSSESSQSLPEQAMRPPPIVPSKSSYANIAASANATAGPSRSRLADGQGRPAYSPTNSSSSFNSSSGPPPLPPRDNVGNVRGRLAAWTAAAAQSGSSSFSRSESSNSLASQFGAQRFPASAQRVLGNAGSAVSKGWAGLRSRGVGGSISSMSSLSQTSSSRKQFEPSGSWSTGLAGRGGRDRTQSDHVDIRNDGPAIDAEAVKRPAEGGIGKVFGRDLVDAGREWGVVDAGFEIAGQSQWEMRRRKCLPAVVVRAVEYLQIWGPKEEGIFRISGRSSHIAKLRKEFDSGADIDLSDCHPGDVDPHAVAGLFKSYLRELPCPLLTHHLSPRFDSYVKGKAKLTSDLIAEDGHQDGQESLQSLLEQLPQAHWFLLADIVKLLDLIPRHASTNRMTLNALMLSLGPSLNISGGVLNELIERRDVFFAEAPALSHAETAKNLIDFGDVAIPPVLAPNQTHSRSPTIASLQGLEDNLHISGSSPNSIKSKKSPRLPSRPSLTKLFGSGSMSIPRQKSVETLSSIAKVSINTSIEAPRVDLAVSPISPLPTFESKIISSTDAKAEPEQQATTAEAFMPTPAAPEKPTGPEASGEKMEEVHYPAGTVEDRAKIFSTPIADRFQSTSSPFPPLRKPRSSTGSTSTVHSVHTPGTEPREGSPNASANPATVIRRGQPVFFQSAGVDRHSRSHSAAGHLGGSGSGLGVGGVKRKEDDKSVEGEISESEGRVKRLSAGPGGLGTVEMIA